MFQSFFFSSIELPIYMYILDMVADVQKGITDVFFYIYGCFYSLLCSLLFTSFYRSTFFFFFFLLRVARKRKEVAVPETKTKKEYLSGRLVWGKFGVLVIISGCGILANWGGGGFLPITCNVSNLIRTFSFYIFIVSGAGPESDVLCLHEGGEGRGSGWVGG